jgi:toxin FitB
MSRHARYVLDTSAVITLPRPHELEVDGEFVVSAITIAELNAGIVAARDPIKLADRVAKLHWLAGTVDVIPYSEVAARRYGELYAMVQAIGRNPRRRQMDLLIASVAVAHELPLVTRNADDFKGLSTALEVVDLNA